MFCALEIESVVISKRCANLQRRFQRSRFIKAQTRKRRYQNPTLEDGLYP